MARHATLPPFLQKLKAISETVPADVADWAEDGLSFVVKDSKKFAEILKQHFKGSLQTFIRQLHFYGFRKLDAHNGGWSFAHKHFRKDKPELICEIRRKTRADSSANGAATQAEVQQLRSQVSQLQDVVEDLRSQLDSVLTCLGTAGVVDVVKKSDGKVERLAVKAAALTNMIEEASSAALKAERAAEERSAAAATRSPSSRKRLRSGGSEEDDEDDDASRTDREDHDDKMSAKAFSLSGKETDVVEDLDMDMEDLDTFQHRDEDFPHFADGTESSSASSLIEPLPVGIDDIIQPDLFDMDESDNIYNDLIHDGEETGSAADFVRQLEDDVKHVEDESSTARASATTAKVVADATELDPRSVSKVLGFLKKAIKSEAASAVRNCSDDLLSFPMLQDAILNYKNSALPTQEVGAN